jgi:hypothetical protein
MASEVASAARNLSELDPQSVRTGPAICPNWTRNLSELDPQSVRTGPAICPNWTRNLSELHQKTPIKTDAYGAENKQTFAKTIKTAANTRASARGLLPFQKIFT